MTGPEHYAEAEALLTSATQMERLLAEQQYDRDMFPQSLATIQSTRDEAQVHATLALAAATAADACGFPHDSKAAMEWRRAVWA